MSPPLVTRRKTKAKVRSAYPISVFLHVHVDDLADNQCSCDGHAGGEIEQLDADGARPKKAHALGVDEIEKDSEDDRKKGKNPSGEASLGSVHANLTLEAEALADDIGGFVEDLGEVSSALFLNEDGGDDDLEILQGDACGKVVHGGLELEAVVLLVEGDAKLLTDGVGRFIGGEIES